MLNLLSERTKMAQDMVELYMLDNFIDRIAQGSLSYLQRYTTIYQSTTYYTVKFVNREIHAVSYNMS